MIKSLKTSISLVSFFTTLIYCTLISNDLLIAQTTSDVNNIQFIQIPRSTPISINQAKNRARQIAEAENGGLGEYRAEYSMHGISSESPYEELEEYWQFTFYGASPGETLPTFESIIRVHKYTGDTIIDYNGAVRGTPEISSINQVREQNLATSNRQVTISDIIFQDTPISLNQAKNRARQVAESENGGLNEYRAEYSMHGQALNSPYEELEEYWQFNFYGRSPRETEPSFESVIRVHKYTGDTIIDYNGAIRETSILSS